MEVLHNFAGLEVMPVCMTGKASRVWIDRVRTVVFRTIFGEILYTVEGSCGSRNDWAQLTGQFREPLAALMQAEKIEKRIALERAAEVQRRQEMRNGHGENT